MILPEFPGWTVWESPSGHWYATRNAVPQIFPATLDALSEEQLRVKLTAQQQKEQDRV